MLPSPQPFATFEVELPVDAAILRGELAVPDHREAGAIFAPASGLSDRDGNDTDVGFRPLAQLASGLAAAGIAVLRSEGRGVGRSGGEFPSPQVALEDFLALIAFAEQLPELGTSPVLIAHGIGCAFATVAASRLGTRLRGLVLISPLISPVGELISFRSDAAQALQSLPLEEHPTVLARIQAEYGRRKSFLPANLKILCPVLAVQGSMDWVFPPAESQRLASQVAGAERLLLDGLDHWLVRSSTWRSATENLDTALRVDPEAIEQIGAWILALGGE